jgi:hypothetical protein
MSKRVISEFEKSVKDLKLTKEQKRDLGIMFEKVMTKYSRSANTTPNENAKTYCDGIVCGLNFAYKIIVNHEDDFNFLGTGNPVVDDFDYDSIK